LKEKIETNSTGTLNYKKKARLTDIDIDIDTPILMRVWQQLEYHIDVCRVTRSARIEHLYLSRKTFSVFLWL
jgi:hypothetical protein